MMIKSEMALAADIAAEVAAPPRTVLRKAGVLTNAP
jgi:hypothetical protein